MNEKFAELKEQFEQENFSDFLEEKHELEETTTFKHAIKILARKDYSRSKLIQKLKDCECPRDEIEPVIDLLIEKQWYKEEYYIEGRIKYFIRKGHHHSSIKRKLAEEDVYVNSETIQAVFDEIKVTTETQILELIQRRMPMGEFPERIPDRVMRYIVARGHEFSKILSHYQEWRNQP